MRSQQEGRCVAIDVADTLYDESSRSISRARVLQKLCSHRRHSRHEAVCLAQVVYFKPANRSFIAWSGLDRRSCMLDHKPAATPRFDKIVTAAFAVGQM